MIAKLLSLFCGPAKKSNVHLLIKNTFSLLLLTLAFNAQAQVSSYTSTHAVVSPAYVDLVSPTDLFGLTWDDNVSSAVNIGFTFNYNGKDYTQCYVSSNGFITFGSAPTATEYTPVSSTAAYEGAIAVYARNILNNNTSISYKTEGVAPNRTFTVQYSFIRTTGTTNAGTYNAQIVLSETTGVIQLKYKTVTTIAAAIQNVSGQVGLRGLSNFDFNNKNYTSGSGAWPAAGFSRGTVNSNTVVTRTGPTANRTNNQDHIITYTPPTCFAPKNPFAQPMSVSADAAIIEWTAAVPAPANGYDYLVTTTPPTNMNSLGYPIGSTAATGTVAAGVTTVSIPSGLTVNTTYYIYVRSKCAGNSGWSAPGIFKTLCTPYGDPAVLPVAGPGPYTQNFNAEAVGSVPPNCNYINTTGATNTGSGSWLISDPSTPNDWGFSSRHVRIRANPPGDPANNSAYIPEAFYFDQTKSYRVSYRYAASAEFSVTAQNLRLAYGVKPVITALTNVLATHTAFRGGPYTNVVNFTVPVSGVYYLGFIDTTPSNNATTLLDDISVMESNCLVPQNPLSGAIASYSAIISWTPPTTAPASGYQYYLSTSGTLPSNPSPIVSVGAGVISANLTGLTANTDYYWWVRSNCGNGDTSGWTLVSTFHTLPAPVLLTYCTPSYSSGAEPICRVIFNGIDNSSSCAVNGAQYSDFRTISTTVNRSSTYPITVYGNTDGAFRTYINVFIDFNRNGSFEASEEFQLGSIYNCSNCAVTGNITIPAGAALGYTTMRVMKRYSTYSTACNSGGYGEAEDYSINIKVPAPPLALTSSLETICAGLSTSVSITGATFGNYNAYSWSPSIATGTAPNYTFTPTSSGVYTLTGLNTTTFETNSVRFEIKINEAPTPVVVTPATSTICQGQTPQMLTATGGIVNGLVVINENFNTGAGGWAASNSGSGGYVDDGNWFLYEDGDYVFSFSTPVHSNDNSGFAAVNSDLQGSGTITDSSLFSPVIDLTGYTTASLSFWHYYYRWNGPESGTVEVSRDGGATFAAADVLYTVSSNTGTASAFVNRTIDLTPYAGMSNLMIRFRYRGTYDYGWAIDNVLITGSASSAVVWTPASGLYLDASATTPYAAGTGSKVVYAQPDTTQTYTATVTTPGGTGCTSTTTATVTVTPLITSEPAPLDQTTCTGIAANDIVITIPGGVTVVRWQYATSAAFTTPLNIPVTTTTLTAAQIRANVGVLTGDTWFRAVVSGCGVKNSNVVKITVPSTTWNGASWSNLAPDGTKMAVYTGNGTIGANMNACALVVKSGTVTVNAGVTVDLAHAVTVDGGSLTFENNASLLQTSTSNSINSGNIVYRRLSQSMVPYDYTYWSSPVDFQTLFNFSPDTRADKFYEWDPVAYDWQQIATPALTVMAPGKGYIIRTPYTTPAGGASYPGVFTGIPNNGTITQQVYVDPLDATKDTNLLGNPYPSALDAEAMMKDPANAVSLGGGTTLYFWSHNHAIAGYEYNDSDYATYNYTGGTGVTEVHAAGGVGNLSIPTRYIAAGQGFIAAIKGSGYSNVVYKNTMRVAGQNTNFYKSAETTEKHRIWLELKDSNSLYKQILVGYIEGATDAYDNGYDGAVLDGGTGITFYSLLGDEKMNTQGKALPFNENDQILLGYNTGTAGMFKIEMPEKDGLFDSQAVYLEDTLLQVIHDLRTAPYNFVTEAGTFNSRFILRYNNTMLNNYKPIFDENAVVVYKDHTAINIKSVGFDIATIKIYDINGRELLLKEKINSSSVAISNLNAAQQVLMIKIISTSGSVVHKKIIF